MSDCSTCGSASDAGHTYACPDAILCPRCGDPTVVVDDDGTGPDTRCQDCGDEHPAWAHCAHCGTQYGPLDFCPGGEDTDG
ncbi:hypothetical protein SAMN05421678_108241 [Actinopolymorpha cephalotaxi]|uniref:DNA-directed RNA polymerase subunit RPC12/RpoP n=1 Tax=Actinopolymorpha cephalotaxi TaxID=504797 RepID=A0A1I2UML5_9ACTN|nr:hypothetical protein [Actinopolymorpha cephalotaxi]NYH86655.1 DNA-directed RNA polymerase subunit RPC12/RpoP [Actinopolymorpha cephalotaxi]SFG78283.1 hypothetical protein SAMN05421678_108241 [Actinopolymorpha cephalotaxi]